MEVQMQTRYKTIDIMKGIMILSVAVYHLVYRVQDGIMDSALRGMTYLLLPVFFVLSGYFYKKGNDNLIKSIFMRLRKFALAPAITAAVLIVVLAPYYIFLQEGYTFHTWVSDALTTFIRPELMEQFLPDYASVGTLFNNLSSVWYIWAMIWASIVFYAVAHFTEDSITKLSIASAILLVVGTVMYIFLPPMSWSLELAPLYAFFMMTGLIFRKMDLIEKAREINIFASLAIAIAAAVSHVFIFRFFGSDQLYRSFFGEYNVLSVLFFVLQTFIGGYVILTVARILRKFDPIGKPLSWVGSHTLVFLIFNGVIGGLASDLLRTYNKMGPNWYVDPLTAEILIKSIITCIISIAGCAALSLLNDKLKERFKKTGKA